MAAHQCFATYAQNGSIAQLDASSLLSSRLRRCRSSCSFSLTGWPRPWEGMMGLHRGRMLAMEPTPQQQSTEGGGGGRGRGRGSGGVTRARHPAMLMDAPEVQKGKYSYDVENAINHLSSLAPRGSIARCMEGFRNKLSMHDFSLIFREFAQRGDWQKALRLFKYMQRHQWCKPNEHVYTIMIGI